MTDLLAVAQGAEASRRAAWAQKFAADERIRELEDLLRRSEWLREQEYETARTLAFLLHATRRSIQRRTKPPGIDFAGRSRYVRANLRGHYRVAIVWSRTPRNA